MTIQELSDIYLSFNEDDDDIIHQYKRYIKTLPFNELVVVLYYMEYGSYRQAAKELNISSSLMYFRMKKIKNKIKKHCK